MARRPLPNTPSPPGGPTGCDHAATTGAGFTSPTAADEDTVVIRAEEQLRVDTETVVVARARVRKVIVTEERTVTVVLRHEEFRLETEPVSPRDALPASLSAGEPAPQSDVIELVLHAERPVVTTEVVPVERVRVSTHLVTADDTTTAPVRREVVELDPPR